MLIAVIDDIAASANNSNIKINFYSDNFGGQGENKFVIAAYLHAVTNVQIHVHSVTHKYEYIDVGHIMRATVSILWLRKILKYLYSPIQSCSVTAYCNYWKCKEERRDI